MDGDAGGLQRHHYEVLVGLDGDRDLGRIVKAFSQHRKQSVGSEWAPAGGLTHTLSESRSRVSDIAGEPASTHPLRDVGDPELVGSIS